MLIASPTLNTPIGVLMRIRSLSLRPCLTAALLLVAACTPRVGQAQLYATPATATECNAAISALKAKTPPAPGSDAWWVATRCGATGGSALASAATKLAATADTAQLRDAELALGDIRDAAVFQSVKSLATNTSATTPARIMALRVLLAQHTGSLHLPTPIRLSPDGQRCVPEIIARDATYSGASLPVEHAQQAFAAAKQVANSSAPADVRLVARCVKEAYAAFVPPDVNPSLLRLTYVCGNKFRVQNPNADWADVRYDVEGTDDSGEHEVPPNGEITIETVKKGTTRLYYNGQLVQSLSNGGTTCTS